MSRPRCTPGLMATVTLVTIGVGFPMLGNERWLSIVVLALFAVLGAQALNIMIGLMGQVSIGNAAFLAIGAFTAALMNERGMGFVMASLAATLVAAVVGAIASIPAFRLRGFYLAISTIALTYAVLYVVAEIQDQQVGASGFRMPYPEFLGVTLDSDLRWYWFLLPLSTLVTAAFFLVSRSSVGRAAQVIRDHEELAPVFGVSTRWMKTVAFAISSGLIGLQGALHAYYIGTVHYENYTLLLAIGYLAMVVLGGLGSAPGAALGAFLITALPFIVNDTLSSFGSGALVAHSSDVTLIVTGAVIIAFLLWQPGGLVSIPASISALIGRKISRRRAGPSRPALADVTTAAADSIEADRPGPQPLLEVSGLTVTYPNGIVALQDVRLSCLPGSATMVVGANGAGKTTLLRVLTGTMSSEKINAVASVDRYRGERLLNRAPNDLTAQGIVLVPERTKFFTGLTTMENLDAVPRRLSDRADSFISRDDVLTLFPRLGHVARTNAALLSGGEKQMLAIGRALLTQPRLLVIDELSLGLAPTIVRDLLQTVQTIRRDFGVTVLMVEQAVRAALPAVDRVVVLRHGVVVLDVPAADWSDESSQAMFLGERANHDRH